MTAANSGRNADVRPTGFAENMFYKSQLAARVSCGASIPAARMPAYQTSALQKHFERYNACNGEEVVKQKGNNKSLHVTAGWDFGAMNIVEPSFKDGSDEDPGYQIGIAGEFGLPFNNQKWSIIVQPTYQGSFGSNPDRHHSSIEIPAGVRHYFFLQKADIFLNGLFVPDLAIKYETSTPFSQNFLVDGAMALSLAAGGGLRMKRLGVEGRYYFQRSYTQGVVLQYSKASVIVSYRLSKLTDK